MLRRTRIFSDLDLNLTAHPISGDIAIRYDESAIKTAVRHLVLTNNYERPFHSEIGSPLQGMLFDLSSPLLNISVKRIIIDLINNFEPRVRLIAVVVNTATDENSLHVSIEFTILNTITPVKINMILERTR